MDFEWYIRSFRLTSVATSVSLVVGYYLSVGC